MTTRNDDVNSAAPLGLRDRKKRRVQRDLYDAAVELVIERGYENVTVEEICERSETSRATFFRYFGTKAGLMVEFDRRIAENIESRFAADELTTAEELYVVQEEMSNAWATVHPNLWELGRDYISSTPVQDFGVIAHEIAGLVESAIERGIAREEVITTLPPQTAAQVFVSSIRVAIRLAVDAGPRSRILSETASVVEVFVNGLIPSK